MEVIRLTDEPRPALIAALHHPATPLVRTFKTFVSVTVGPLDLYFDTADDLRKWHAALGAEIEGMHQAMFDEAKALTDPEERLVRMSEIPPGAHVWRAGVNR